MKEGMFFVLFLIMLTSICDTASQLFLKTSINDLNLHIDGIRSIARFILRLIKSLRLWVGFLFSVASLLIWLFVLSKADLNFAFSADSMHYIFIALASVWILKERIPSARWLGIIFIMGGIALVSIG
jgi:drug/metabolite transporter (DMT)-like permease